MRKKFVIRWELDGKRVAAHTPGAVKRRDFVGYVQKIGGREVMLGRLKETARTVAAEKVRDSELKRRGILPEVAGAERSIMEAVEGYVASLEAKERSAHHLGMVHNKLARVVKDCAWVRVSDATLEGLESWINRKRRDDAPGAKRFSVQTANHYRAAWRAWGNWLVKANRVLHSPFRGVEKTNAETDRRHIRRALTSDEVEFLLEQVEKLATRATMSGPERAMLYRVAVSTGLRARELSTLTPTSFSLTTSPPFLTLEARASKSRRKTEQPIPRALASILIDFLRHRPATEPIWAAANPARNKMGICLRADCAAARGNHPAPPAGFLESRPGAVIDFHALRGTYLSALAPNVSASVLGRLGRHASVQTTERHYVSHRLAALAESLEGAGLSWFSHGSPDERKKMKQGGTRLDRAEVLFGRFMNTLKPLEKQAFIAKIALLITREDAAFYAEQKSASVDS